MTKYLKQSRGKPILDIGFFLLRANIKRLLLVGDEGLASPHVMLVLKRKKRLT